VLQRSRVATLLELRSRAGVVTLHTDRFPMWPRMRLGDGTDDVRIFVALVVRIDPVRPSQTAKTSARSGWTGIESFLP
jgi:hypothetical protein